LSKASNTEFCGRVLVFLASAFTLSERSAVNVKSLYNTGNATEFEELDVPEEEEEGVTGMAVEMLPQHEEGAPVDANFYNTFWGIQKYFVDPTMLYQADAWSQLTAATTTIFDAFESLWLSKKGSATGASVVDDFYVPKFLTSSRLMNLQLKDPYFCRHFLVQYLILIQCLRSVKARTPIQELKEAQRKHLADAEKRALALLENMTSDGVAFTAAVVAILDRENNWIQWKSKGCKPYEREAPQDATQGGKRKRDAETCESDEGGTMGEPALSKLWEQEAANLESLKGETRNFVPQMKNMLSKVCIELNPENDIEDCYRETKQKEYAWRTIRVVAQQQLSVIKHASGQGKQVDKQECSPDGIAMFLMEEYQKEGLA